MGLSAQADKAIGRVIDRESGRPLADVQVMTDDSSATTTTNDFGYFSIALPDSIVTLQFHHVSYESQTFRFQGLPAVDITIALRRNIREIQPIVISPEEVSNHYESRDLSVIDFKINDSGLWLLLYNYAHATSSLVRYREGQPTDSLDLPHKHQYRLVENCFDQLFLLRKRTYTPIIPDGSLLLDTAGALSDAAWLHRFHDCAAAGDGFRIIRKQHSLVPNSFLEAPNAIFYYYKDTAAERLLTAVYDTTTLRRLQEHYNFLIRKYYDPDFSGNDSLDLMTKVLLDQSLDWQPGSDHPLYDQLLDFRNSWSGDLLRESAYLEIIVNKPVYVPIFSYGDSLLLFDHASGYLITFHQKRPIRRRAIDYHREPQWKPLVLFDHVQGKAYTVFRSLNKWRMACIDLKTGSLGPATEIPFLGASNFHVHDGRWYFLYRELPAPNYRLGVVKL